MTRIAHQNNFMPAQKATGYHLGPVAPPTDDGASLTSDMFMFRPGPALPPSG